MLKIDGAKATFPTILSCSDLQRININGINQNRLADIMNIGKQTIVLGVSPLAAASTLETKPLTRTGMRTPAAI